jgi:hypothetical protein
MSIKNGYFCPNIKKVVENGVIVEQKCGNLLTKDMDSACFKRVGMCCECEADLHTHLAAKKFDQKIKLLEFLKNHKDDLFLDDDTNKMVVEFMKVLYDDEIELVDNGNLELTNSSKNNN